jgi:hypothetical protein
MLILFDHGTPAPLIPFIKANYQSQLSREPKSVPEGFVERDGEGERQAADLGKTAGKQDDGEVCSS